MANTDIKRAAAGAGVRLWQIAEELGMRDCNFSRRMRHELSVAEKEKILEIINMLSVDSEGGDTNDD